MACPGGGLLLEWHPAEPAEDQYSPPRPCADPVWVLHREYARLRFFRRLAVGRPIPLFKKFVLLETHFLHFSTFLVH